VDSSKKDGTAIERLAKFYARHIVPIWVIIIVAPWTVLAFLSVAFPREVYDGFVYPYFWAPIVADAVPGSGESTNYNAVNTTVYALCVVIAMLGLYEVRKRNVLEAIPVDERLVLSLLPLMILGGLLRALQDSALFGEPATYLFIAPLIYVMICAFAAPIIIFSIWTTYPKEPKLVLRRFVYGCIGMIVIYTLIFYLAPGQLMFYFDVPVFIIFVVIGFAIYYILSDRFHPAYSAIFSYSTIILIYFVATVALWGSIPAWTSNYLRFDPSGATPRLLELPLIIAITAVITLVYFAFGYLIKRKYAIASRLVSIENLLLVFGQMIDATATWRGIDAYGYAEKNVLPIALVQGAGSGVALFLLKLLIVLPLIYLLDIVLEKEMKGRESLRTIVKAGIMILGMGPGIRDATRISMGI
jgi:uncharacterized membrane protein